MRYDIAGSGRSRKPREGFTLIEMAIVFIIIAVIAAVTAFYGAGAVEQTRQIQTERKLDRIENALLSYRSQNNALPCPGSLTLTESDPNYGLAATTTTCLGGTPAADYSGNIGSVHDVAEGAVPVQTLGLPPEFMYDAWGRRIFYAVDVSLTQYEAFKNYTIFDHCKAVQVKDEAGGDRTNTPNGAAYALLSTGPNGHGGFQKNGTRYNAGIDETAQKTNCYCDASAIPTTPWFPKFVQQAASAGGSSFDDLVRFKERWQIQSIQDGKAPSYVGPDVAFVGGGANAYFYTQNCDSFTPLTITPAPISAQAYDISISSDNVYWAVGHSASPYVTILKRITTDGDIVATSVIGDMVPLASPKGIDAAPQNIVHGVAFSQSGTFLAVVSQVQGMTLAYLHIYKNNGDDHFIEKTETSGPSSELLDQPAVEISSATSVVFSPRDNYLALVAGGKLIVYQHSEDSFTKMTNIPALTGLTTAVFSPDGRYLLVGGTDADTLKVYDYSNGSFVQVTPQSDATLASQSAINEIAFSADSQYAAVTKSGATQIYRMNVTNGQLTAVNPSLTGGNAVAFSPHSNIIGISNSSHAQFYRYNSANDNFSLMQDITSVDGSGAIAFRH